VAAQEGFRRLRRLSVYLTLGSLAGFIMWVIEVRTVGRWGPGELFFLVSPLLIAALSLRVIVWVVEGFFQNPSDSPSHSSSSDTTP
jgi:hypothetical protein